MTSGTPLPKKLGIRAGLRVALVGAPPGFDAKLGAPPDGVVVTRAARGVRTLDLVVLFARAVSDIEARLGAAARALAYDGGLWIAWPKRSSGVKTDVTEDEVRARGLATGLVDNKIAAIDETWSALRFVHRIEDRSPKAKNR